MATAIPLILITNDDGVNAKGINELVATLRPLGELLVIAPDGPRSGMSSAITSLHPLQAEVLRKEEGLTVYRCNGTPVDCVKLGVNELAARKPDLVVSGINHGSNAGVSVIYSGTLGAAIEGCIFGIPSIGVSLTDHAADADFSQAVVYARRVAEHVLTKGLPSGVCLNLNVPNIDRVKSLRVCVQTRGYWTQEFMASPAPQGKTVYWLTGEFKNEDPDNPETDEWALAHGYAALVPVRIDMTAYDFVATLKEYDF